MKSRKSVSNEIKENILDTVEANADMKKKYSFTCPGCKQVFHTTIPSYKRHCFYSCKGDMPCMCSKCHADFPNSYTMRKHEKECDGPGDFVVEVEAPDIRDRLARIFADMPAKPSVECLVRKGKQAKECIEQINQEYGTHIDVQDSLDILRPLLIEAAFASTLEELKPSLQNVVSNTVIESEAEMLGK